MKIGLTANASELVTANNTAATLGSGFLDVYATPAMIALMEKAASLAVADFLPATESTVGISLNVQHSAATPLGQQVTATATLVAIEGKKLVFEVTAKDEQKTIGQGNHERFIINIEKFLNKLK